MVRGEGTVTDWDDAKGFGFITPSRGGRRVFLHVSAMPRGRRPAVGDTLTYTEARDSRNRVRATEVRAVARGAAASGRGVARGIGTGRSRALVVAAGVASASLGVVAALAAADRVSLAVPVAALLLSLVSFMLYATDKSAAQRGRWRVAESTLHLCDLLGGWPGGLVARHALRHKTRKQPFRTVFWTTVAVNVAAVVWLVVARPAWAG
jgi:uncharacterized membrane protein YsdA (DUF1294 family)/cold shock CspA family protein